MMMPRRLEVGTTGPQYRQDRGRRYLIDEADSTIQGSSGPSSVSFHDEKRRLTFGQFQENGHESFEQRFLSLPLR